MTGTHFDRWTQSLAARAGSRRGLLGAALGALALPSAAAASQSALACRGNGRRCDPGDNQDFPCCSGSCKRKRNGRGVCKPAPGARGCTIEDATCTPEGEFIPCPQNEDGFCLLLDNGRPYCAVQGRCTDCVRNRDCTIDGVRGKCISQCNIWQLGCSLGRGCVFPTEVFGPN